MCSDTQRRSTAASCGRYRPNNARAEGEASCTGSRCRSRREATSGMVEKPSGPGSLLPRSRRACQRAYSSAACNAAPCSVFSAWSRGPPHPRSSGSCRPTRSAMTSQAAGPRSVGMEIDASPRPARTSRAIAVRDHLQPGSSSRSTASSSESRSDEDCATTQAQSAMACSQANGRPALRASVAPSMIARTYVGCRLRRRSQFPMKRSGSRATSFVRERAAPSREGVMNSLVGRHSCKYVNSSSRDIAAMSESLRGLVGPTQTPWT